MRRERLTTVEPGDVGEMAARSEHASDLAQGGRTIGHELHRERADGHVHGRRGQRHRLGAGNDDAGVAGLVAAKLHRRQGQHLGGGVEGDDLSAVASELAAARLRVPVPAPTSRMVAPAPSAASQGAATSRMRIAVGPMTGAQ